MSWYVQSWSGLLCASLLCSNFLKARKAVKHDSGCFHCLAETCVPGNKGDVGTDGRPGYQGPAGEPGVCKGDMGEIGQPGGLGIPGTKGDQGEQGPGISGPKGEKGDTGPQGPVGMGGVKGVKGELGLTGIPGPCSPAIQSAFSAKLTNMYPAPDQPVPFTAVIYNIQFHYNPSSGVYRAHVNGTYVFSYQLVAYSKPLKVGLFLNFIPVVKSTEIVTLETASQQVVLHLYMGDQVWLQVKDQNNNGMYTGTEYSSIFSGFLLYPDSCDMPLFREMDNPIINNGKYNWN
uniref:C1q domain-containing protein n=1 Tax=Electrophorus electricus TaxID=8005 RepID=A0A4W4FE33_ELEEL